MKKYIVIQLSFVRRQAPLAGLVFLAALLFNSCDFTEVELPSSQLVSASVFKDRATANAAMSSVYAGMRDSGMLSGTATGLSSLLGNYTDELQFYGSPQNGLASFYSNALVQSSGDVKTLWMNAYTQIYSANSVLEGVAASQELSEADKLQLTGEALFARALLHLYLTETFGDVPYVTSTDYRLNSIIGKKTAVQVHMLVIQDLGDALERLPEAYIVQDRTRPNRYAAHALLARAYLYSGDWAAAADHASAVINNNSLYTDAAAPDGAFLLGSPATIWQFSPSSPGGNTREGVTFIFNSGPPPLSALTEGFVAAFEPGDIRKEAWIREITDGAQEWYHPFKYRENSNTGSSVEHSIVLRLAEMYLVRAEARVRAGDLISGAGDLDHIRNLAGLGNTAATTQQGLLDAILAERRVELFTEFGHRFYDLKRFGQIDAELFPVKPGWDATDKLLPLPESELNLNPNMLPQNPGY